MGAFSGTIMAHFLAGEPALKLSGSLSSGFGQWLGEFIATSGLIITIFGCIRVRPEAIAYALGLYITAVIGLHHQHPLQIRQLPLSGLLPILSQALTP